MAIRVTFRLSAVALVLIAQAALCTAADAQGGRPDIAGFAPSSKSEAILGGQSALEAVLSQQQAAIAPPRAMIAPATYAMPGNTRARLPLETVVYKPAVSNRPDVFGSVALHVSRTPLDRKWQYVAKVRLRGEPARYASSISELSPIEQLEAVNRYVNRHVRFMEDGRQFGVADRWSTAMETLRTGRGDCEDYAIAKLHLLRRAGFSDRDLYLTIVRDLVRRADHAILIARMGDRLLVLDNGTDELLDSNLVADYRPMLSFASNGEWAHGYRLAKSPNATSVAQAVGTAAPAADQRSRNASLLAFNTGFIK